MLKKVSLILREESLFHDSEAMNDSDELCNVQIAVHLLNTFVQKEILARSLYIFQTALSPQTEASEKVGEHAPAVVDENALVEN